MREFLRIYGYANNAMQHISQKLSNIFGTNVESVVFLCLGTDRVIFDSLGCMVGQMLKSNNLPHYVYGDLNHCITGKNVGFAVDYIRTMHPHAILCVIDAMATRDQIHLDEVVIADQYIGSLSNGTEINADIFVYGITTVCNKNIKLGAGTRLYAVYKLAQVIAQSIMLASNQHYPQNFASQKNNI